MSHRNWRQIYQKISTNHLSTSHKLKTIYMSANWFSRDHRTITKMFMIYKRKNRYLNRKVLCMIKSGGQYTEI